MPNEDNKILKYNHGEKSKKVPFIIYANLESLLEKMSICHNNPKNSSTTSKINKHTLSGYSLFTHCSFDLANNRLDCYRGNDCMEKFCNDLKEHAAKMIMKKRMKMKKISLIKSKKYVIYAKKDLVLMMIIKSIIKSEVIITTQENIVYNIAHSICELRYKTSKEISVVCDNGSTFDYHFIIKELAKKCLWVNLNA